MTDKQEKMLRDQLNCYVSKNIIRHKEFDRCELTYEEFTQESEQLTNKMLHTIDWILKYVKE